MVDGAEVASYKLSSWPADPTRNLWISLIEARDNCQLVFEKKLLPVNFIN